MRVCFVLCPVFMAALSLPVFAFASGSGSLAVTARPSQALVSIPQGAQRVRMLSLRLQASCDADVQVTSLMMRHAGLGAVTDILRIYMLNGDRRISSAVSVPAREDRELRLRRFTVPACGSAEVTLAADFASTAQSGAEHRFSLAAVNADASVTIGADGQDPLSTLQVSPHTKQASVRVTFRDVLTSLYYGSNRTVARLLLTGIGSDQRIRSITFTNEGSARDADLRNLFLETASGIRLSETVPHMDDRRVTVMLDPGLELRRNEAKLLHLKADIRAGRSHTIDWAIEEPSDIMAEEVSR
ncbi:MAG: hypothetical protein PHW10_01250 [Candidatus Peribacteraceae bacterium]|nr:hypothetical protein [Candidatus Peribacteraceae bacterium]